jgi:aconitate decarboxylase
MTASGEGNIMGGLTVDVATFAANLRYDTIPQSIIGAVKNGLTDYAAVTVLGKSSDVVELLASFEDIDGWDTEASLFFSRKRTSARTAALLNGASGHAHDYDDVGLSFHPAHPSVALAPAIFAEAEALRRSGRDVLTAYVAGYEVWGEIGSRDARPQHLKGWHPTGTFGAIAAAAACANLRRLDPVKTAHALGIAASQASGIVGNFGTMTKPFHAGHAAQSGLMAARYAQAGMTASPEILEYKNGFLRAVSPDGDVDVDRPARFHERWFSLDHGIGVKLYPMCYGTHRLISRLTQYAIDSDLHASQIEHVRWHTGPSRVVALVHSNPQKALDAKFSAEFAVAMSIIARRATLAEVTDEFVGRADVRALMGKVERDLDSALDQAVYSDRPMDALHLSLTGGRSVTLDLPSPRDSAIDLDALTLWTKFRDCTKDAMNEADARDLFDRLQALEACRDLRQLSGETAIV